jgi:hypothetical protein
MGSKEPQRLAKVRLTIMNVVVAKTSTGVENTAMEVGDVNNRTEFVNWDPVMENKRQIKDVLLVFRA